MTDYPIITPFRVVMVMEFEKFIDTLPVNILHLTTIVNIINYFFNQLLLFGHYFTESHFLVLEISVFRIIVIVIGILIIYLVERATVAGA